MIIVGSMGIPFTRAKGEFYCPRCRTTKPFRDRHVRRFLTLYFIPLIPLDKIEEFVECGGCKEHFNRGALTYSPEAAAQLFSSYVRYTLALLVVADKVLSPAEVEAFQNLVRRLTGEAPTKEEATDELLAAEGTQQSVPWFLSSIAHALTADEKRTLVQYAFWMVSANGDISATRNELLTKFPLALQITEEAFKQYIEEAIATG